MDTSRMDPTSSPPLAGGQREKKRRNRLRLSCIPCADRRQVSAFPFRDSVEPSCYFCIFPRNATVKNLVVFALREIYPTNAVGRTDRTLVLLQAVHRITQIEKAHFLTQVLIKRLVHFIRLK